MQKMDFYSGKPANAVVHYLLAKNIVSASFILSFQKMAILRSGLESQSHYKEIAYVKHKSYN